MSPAQDVPELRDLVDPRAAQGPADRRHPRIVGRREDGARLDLRALPHRAQLPELERPAVPAHPRLPVEDAAARRHRDDERGRSASTGSEQEQQRPPTTATSKARFSDAAGAVERAHPRLEQRQVADDAESQPPDHRLERRRPDEQVRAASPAGCAPGSRRASQAASGVRMTSSISLRARRSRRGPRRARARGRSGGAPSPAADEPRRARRRSRDGAGSCRR